MNRIKLCGPYIAGKAGLIEIWDVKFEKKNLWVLVSVFVVTVEFNLPDFSMKVHTFRITVSFHFGKSFFSFI